MSEGYLIFLAIFLIFSRVLCHYIHVCTLILDDFTIPNLYLHLLKSFPSCFSSERKPNRSTSWCQCHQSLTLSSKLPPWHVPQRILQHLHPWFFQRLLVLDFRESPLTDSIPPWLIVDFPYRLVVTYSLVPIYLFGPFRVALSTF